MCASGGSAFWPQVVAVSLIAFAAASCSSDSGRFSDIFGSDSSSHNEVTGSITPGAPGSRVDSRPMPKLARADAQGISGGGRGMGSYQRRNSEITGSLRPTAPPPPTWTWEGGTPITVAPGETLEMIARRHGVPVTAIMRANNITSPAMVHAGEHLVIPRYRPSAAAYAPPATRLASAAPARPGAMSVGAPRAAVAPRAGVHIVAPRETLHSIARLYGKPVLVLAKANNIPPDTMVKVGERIIIPDVRATPRAEVRARAPAGPDVAAAESPHSARIASPVAPAAQEGPVKAAQRAGGMPNFRWPVRGRIIAGFGPKPNGLQNDGINFAVPEGTPIKAAEDGVVAYAGNELKGYGNLVLIRHSNGFVTAYAHANEILVKRGEAVKRGQVIARSGQTGNVSSPQLHFEIRKGATPVDPAQYLSGA
jgi:murein DD-endopeptidase MepM/ murein hydrolase activator NlpD